MKTIEYQATYADGETEVIRVKARDVNTGFPKAVREAMKPLGNGTRREIHSVQFWQVL